MLDNHSPDRRPTLRDVASTAGLSVTQTSRALNGHSDVAEATRQRAMEAAEKVGYRPNLEARRLKMPETRSNSIALVLSSPSQRFSDPFLGGLLSSIAHVSADKGFELQLTTATESSDPLTIYERLIQTKRVDGFILLRVETKDPRVRYLSKRGFPFVTLGRPHGTGFSTVSSSPDALQPVVDHLVELGHRRIAAVVLPSGYAIADHRLASFEKAVAGFGTIIEPVYVGGDGYHEDTGLTAAEELFSQANRPTAIVAFNELLAAGVLRSAAKQGLAIPQDLTLVSVDDTIVARHASPPLTALQTPAAEFGSLLVEQLVARVNGQSPSHRHVGADLVVRESSG